MAREVTDKPKFWEDTSFVEGDSPSTINFNSGLGRNATEGIIHNDGNGDFYVSFSSDGVSYGDNLRIMSGENFKFERASYYSARITWIADSAYRVIAV